MNSITCINSAFFNGYQIHNFIWNSFYTLSSIKPQFLELNEYKLLYFVIDDFTTNLNSLYMANIHNASFLFPNIKRNTRHMIEAYLDLYNLCHDKDYIHVLRYSSKIYKKNLTVDDKKNLTIPEKYFKYAHNGKYKNKKYINPSGTFTIQSKCKISEELYDSSWHWKGFFEDYCSDCNTYAHPDSFIKPLINPYSDFDLKRQDLYRYLNLNLNILDSAYRLFVAKFNNNCTPILSCPNCQYNRNCLGCYSGSISQFKNILDNCMLEDVAPPNNINYY